MGNVTKEYLIKQLKNFERIIIDEKYLVKVAQLPTASETNLDKFYFLTSDQTGYFKGGIYQCVSDGEATPTYSWQLISIPLATLKSVVTASSDFADYQTRIAAL